MTDDLSKYTRPPEYADEERYLLMESGSIYDRKAGRICYGPKGGGKYTITKENASAMLARRKELSRQAADEAIDEGAGIDPSKYGTGEGWKAIIRHTVQVYLKSSNIRGMGEVLSKLAMAAGYTTSENEEPRDDDSQFRDLISEMAQLLRQAREESQRDIVEGKISD
jgi:hypothetical protein